MSAAGALPLVDLKAQYAGFQAEMDAAILEVVKSQYFVLGPVVERFEKEFAAYCGAKHCVCMQSGTSALWLMLWASGVGPGDEVITSPLTFYATVEAIQLCGATPVFVDVDDATLNLDASKLEAAITKKTKAILPVHLYGQPVDMDAVLAAAKKKGVPVFEDAAQAAGASYKDKKAGTLAKAAAFSFYPGKNLGAYGDAGGVVTDDDALAKSLRLLRNHGMEPKNLHHVLGVNARMEAIQGAVLSVKLKRLDAWNAARRRLAARYREKLAGVKDLRCVVERPESRSNYHLFVVRHPRRDALLKHLQGSGIQADIHYPVAQNLQAALGPARLKPGSMPVCEKAVGEILSLPLFPEMTDAQLDRVVAAVKSFK